MMTLKVLYAGLVPHRYYVPQKFSNIDSNLVTLCSKCLLNTLNGYYTKLLNNYDVLFLASLGYVVMFWFKVQIVHKMIMESIYLY